mmetsp:Transcript_18265/g.35288  ORF Transcript_18265/g.35288 Transcript_18265/m.35288 type:complete len:289 (-) Transcript_18265:72-938(-)
MPTTPEQQEAFFERTNALWARLYPDKRRRTSDSKKQVFQQAPPSPICSPALFPRLPSPLEEYLMLCSVDNEQQGSAPRANEVWSAHWAEPDHATPTAKGQEGGFLLPPTGPSPASDCYSGFISSPSLSRSTADNNTSSNNSGHSNPDAQRNRHLRGERQQAATHDAPRLPVGLKLAKALDMGLLTKRARTFCASLQRFMDDDSGEHSGSLYLAALARTAARAIVRVIRDAGAKAADGGAEQEGEARGESKTLCRRPPQITMSHLASLAGISPLLIDDFRRRHAIADEG